MLKMPPAFAPFISTMLIIWARPTLVLRKESLQHNTSDFQHNLLLSQPSVTLMTPLLISMWHLI